MLPVVALVGRPNVGKSTIFNALTKTRDALVADRPGVTRDRHYGICRSETRSFLVVDTGGISGVEDALADLAEQQSRAAILEAAVVVFVLDARDGLLPQDHDILAEIRRQDKSVFLVVNKCDGTDEENVQAEFSALGVSPTLLISAAHRQGMDVLLESILQCLPELPEAEQDADPNAPRDIRVAIVGRPNVGKSTLVNRLLGEDRVIASEIPGTTRDAIFVPMQRDGVNYTLIDTAGVRRRARVEDAVEKFSVIKTLQAMEVASVIVVMLDAHAGITEQDATVLGHALESGRALVIAINKWDGMTNSEREWCKSELDRKLDFVTYVERIFIAAREGTGMRELMAAVIRAHTCANRDFSSSELTKALEIAYESHTPPLVRGKAAKLRYAHLGGKNPIRVVIHGSRLKDMPMSYKRYLENFLRTRYKLVGTPIRLEMRDGENPFDGKVNKLTEKQVRKKRRIIRHHKK